MDVRVPESYWSASKSEKDRMFDQMLSKFINSIQVEGLIPELKRREFYEKPNEKRRRKEYEASIKKMKKERRKFNAIHHTGKKGGNRRTNRQSEKQHSTIWDE